MGGTHHGVGLHRARIERHGVHRLSPVDDQCRPPPTLFAGGRRLDHSDARAGTAGQPMPDVHVGRELSPGDEHALPAPQRGLSPHCRHPVGRRGNDGDALRVDADQAREALAYPIQVVEEVIGFDLAGDPLARQSLHPGGLDPPRQRRHVGCVEIVEAGRQREGIALAGEGLHRSR